MTEGTTDPQLSPQLDESLTRGLGESAAGQTVDLGDFTQYANDATEDDGVTVHVTLRVRNHGTTPAELRQAYESWAADYGRDTGDPASAVDALQDLPSTDVTVTSVTIEGENV